MEIVGTKRLDNLGIVMGTLREFGIIDLIDQKIGKDDQHNVSTGEAVAAMVMNGLGFANRPLSLTPQFFKTKALDILFSRELNPDELNRHRLGRALDDIHSYGCELLFQKWLHTFAKRLALTRNSRVQTQPVFPYRVNTMWIQMKMKLQSRTDIQKRIVPI